MKKCAMSDSYTGMDAAPKCAKGMGCQTCRDKWLMFGPLDPDAWAMQVHAANRKITPPYVERKRVRQAKELKELVTKRAKKTVARPPQKAPAKRINSRTKGKAGELELKEVLRAHGFTDARRGQQFSGGTDSPDVVCASLPGIHIECKRTENGNLYNWLAQAQRDCGRKVPVVMHRRSKKEWVAILTVSQFLALVKPK